MPLVSSASLDFSYSAALLEFCCGHVTSSYVKSPRLLQTPFPLQHIKLAAARHGVRVPEHSPAVEGASWCRGGQGFTAATTTPPTPPPPKI